ncbi:MAG TPA: hypothetical protein VM695_05440 [Phycisphaerae bacterium]|nr:hypothetical protein [Phycisphaerae bacterium]
MVENQSKSVSGGRNREAVMDIIRGAFRREFPEDTVDISDGYKDNIHVLVVSRRFDDLTEQQKQDLMWQIIDGTDLTDDEKRLISLAYPVSPAEIK